MRQSYILCNRTIPATRIFKDLGITINDRLSFDEHVSLTVNKARRMLGMISRSFSQRDIHASINLYKTYVRSKLEFGNILWQPYTQRNIKLVESVQRRMTKRLPGFGHLPYRERLYNLKIQSLQARRIRYHLIFLYKAVHGYVDLDIFKLFDVVTNSSTRGNHFRLYTSRCHHNYRNYFFTGPAGIAQYWNMLSDAEINVESVSKFKVVIERLFQRLDIW